MTTIRTGRNCPNYDGVILGPSRAVYDTGRKLVDLANPVGAVLAEGEVVALISAGDANSLSVYIVGPVDEVVDDLRNRSDDWRSYRAGLALPPEEREWRARRADKIIEMRGRVEAA